MSRIIYCLLFGAGVFLTPFFAEAVAPSPQNTESSASSDINSAKVPSATTESEDQEVDISGEAAEEDSEQAEKTPSAESKIKRVAGVPSIRGALGTDANLGTTIGLGAAYTWFPETPGIAFEFGLDLFYNSSKEEDTEKDPTFQYDEKTKLTLFGVRANTLFNYYPAEDCVFFIAGIGFLIANTDWKVTKTNRSTGATSAGAEADGITTGNLFNFGIGYALKNGIELRLETPLIYLHNPSGGSPSFVPTITAGLQYRFF